MKQTKIEKVEKSKELGDRLKGAHSIFITEFQGLKFVELYDLRGKLRPTSARYAVTKNSLLRHALKNAGLDGVSADALKGPVAVVVGAGEDPVAPARVLANFAKEFPKLKVKAGYVSGQWLSSEDCKKLSQLGTKPELLAKVLGALLGTLQASAAVLQAPIRDLALTLKALEEKKKAEPA